MRVLFLGPNPFFQEDPSDDARGERSDLFIALSGED